MQIGAPKRANHFFLPEDQHLFDYDQIFSVSSLWVELGMEDVTATYDLYVRGLPQNRNFLLFGGLEEIIEALLTWRYTKDEVQFLFKHRIITKKMAKILRTYRFTGDVWAMQEGTVFFSEEPVVRLTGKIWEINLFTFFLINALSSNTIFLSKIVRSVLAADGKVNVVTCPVTRAHANEASLKFGRAAYLLGSPSAIVPAFARKFNIPMSKVNTKAYHAFIKSFPSEIEAMRAAVGTFSGIGLMVDTYNFKTGVANAIIVAKEMWPRGKTIGALVIDSGKDVADFARQARYARRALDHAGFPNVRVTITGNFDEQRIAELVHLKAPVNGVIACTELVTSSDDPKLEAVLKLAEYTKDKKVYYSMKLTPGKTSLPGTKQVFRKFKNGKMIGDCIGLEHERFGVSLLKRIIMHGKLVARLPRLDVIKQYVQKQLQQLPNALRDVEHEHNYSVTISKTLQALARRERQHH